MDNDIKIMDLNLDVDTVKKIFKKGNEPSDYILKKIVECINNPKRGPQNNNMEEFNKKEIEEIKAKLRYIREKGKSKKWQDSLNGLVEWWFDSNQYDTEKGEKCFYCGITKKELDDIIDHSNEIDDDYKSGRYHKSKKGRNAWNNSNMEIDKKNPNMGYNKDNCVFACHLCNNAKTDIVQFEDFKDYIGPGIKKYYDSLSNTER